MMIKSILNIFLRGITIFSKFIFIFFLGKYSLDETTIGVYGMISTSIAILIYIIGFDFYVFNVREIISDKENIRDKVINQLIFHLIGYSIILPIVIPFIFYFNFVDWKYIYVFIFLVISEHLGQEVYRLLTAFKKTVLANSILFIRSGLWFWIVLYDFFIANNEIDLTRYIYYWLFFSLLAIIISSFYLKPLIKNPSERVLDFKTDFSWIRKGIKGASIFFIGSISFQIIQFSDRFMIDYYLGKKMVGVYTTYAQFVNALDIFVFSGVTMIFYPKLIEVFSDKKKYKEMQKKYSKKLFLMTIVLVIILIILAPIILEFMKKKSMINHLNTFYILVIASFFLITSNIYHYDLYVKKKDRFILSATIISMISNILFNIFLIPQYGIFGASLSTLVSFIIIFSYKLFYSKKFKNS